MTDRMLCGVSMLALEVAGSGFLGLDRGDRIALGLMMHVHQKLNGGDACLNVSEAFVEAHCTALPPYWGPKTHPRPTQCPVCNGVRSPNLLADPCRACGGKVAV